MPDDLHDRLRRVAGEDADDRVVSEFALAVIRREVERLEWKEQWDELPVSQRAGEASMTQLQPGPALSWEEWRKRLAQRPKTNTVPARRRPWRKRGREENDVGTVVRATAR